MCRHVGYLGPATTLSGLLLEPEHSLLEQSWAPADMRGGGKINADGFGVGWYDTPEAPAVYRNDRPIWTDEAFREVARIVRSTAVVGAVRSATVGMPLSPAACAPFRSGKWMFSHNGKVIGWPNSLSSIASRLDPAALMTLPAPTDSAVLWALLHQLLEQGVEPGKAIRSLLVEVEQCAPGSRLNFLLTDGDQLFATTWTHALWVRRTRSSVTVASEPFGPAVEWQRVPDRQLLTAVPGRVTMTPIPGTESYD